MTARKKGLAQMDDFISLGGMELEKQTPAQRGIQAPENPKGNKSPKYPKDNKQPEQLKEPKGPETSEQPKEPKSQKYPKNNKEPKEPKASRRVRWCVNLDEDVIAWAKRAVYHTPGLTLSELVEQALLRELPSLERKRGEAFPDGGKVKVGRPVKI